MIQILNFVAFDATNFRIITLVAVYDPFFGRVHAIRLQEFRAGDAETVFHIGRQYECRPRPDGGNTFLALHPGFAFALDDADDLHIRVGVRAGGIAGRRYLHAHADRRRAGIVGNTLEQLKTMFQWVGHNRLCYPADFVSLSDPELKSIEERRDRLRKKMRDGYVNVHKVLSAYENSYQQFVEEDRPQTFMNFLENAESSYLLLANHVSVATHSVNLWKWYIEQYGAELRHRQFMEMFDGLCALYGVDRVAAFA